MVEAPSGEPWTPPVTRRSRSLLVVLVVFLAVIAFLTVTGFALLRQQGGANGIGVHADSQVGLIHPGPAPDFQIQLYSGGAFHLAAQRGKPVLVNYWASWCPPCREEAPVLEGAWQRYQSQGLIMVGLDIWDTEVDARKFIGEFGITYPNDPDPRGNAAIDYGVTGIPESFFIRRDGTVALHWIGPLTEAQINHFVEEILQ
ncbi:MAG: TlpA family protein disulfide reductase [Chloroflexi bacterium]|nr:TlpA family protein disulfide reductase [Chloroflexota bacterium]